MKWDDLSEKKSLIFQARPNHMRITLVFGHRDYRNEWIVSVYPDIFKGVAVVGGNEMSKEEAKKEAENMVRQRLESMLKSLE